MFKQILFATMIENQKRKEVSFLSVNIDKTMVKVLEIAFWIVVMLIPFAMISEQDFAKGVLDQLFRLLRNMFK
jgi:ABC-type sulfate transport system permease subunit